MTLIADDLAPAQWFRARKTVSWKHAFLPLLALTVPALGVVSTALRASAQSAATSTGTSAYMPTLTFDLASIREGHYDAQGGITLRVDSPARLGRLDALNLTAANLITMAYGIASYQLIGGPDWLSVRHFVVHARADASVDAALAKLTNEQAVLEKQHMMQVLLAERFGLKVHHGFKELAVFALTATKKGAKLQPSSAASTRPDEAHFGPTHNSPDEDAPSYQQRCDSRGCELTAKRTPLSRLASILTGQVNAPVQDHTGLQGAFDFTLQWRGLASAETAGHDALGPETASQWPPLFTALQEQLGLRLTSARGPVEVIIIDQVEQPTEN